MRKLLGVILIIGIVLSACTSTKPYYKTAKGKKKKKYYNSIEFGGKKFKGQH